MEDLKQQIIKDFQKKFIRGHGPISNGDNYPQDAESWVEADEEDIQGWIWEKLDLAFHQGQIVELTDTIKTLQSLNKGTGGLLVIKIDKYTEALQEKLKLMEGGK